MNKLGKKINWLLGMLFAGYWVYTLLSVISLERNVAHRERIYGYSNFVPALCVLIILLVMFKFAGRKITNRFSAMGKKEFYILLILISVIVFGIQLYLMKYLGKAYRYDFGTIRKTAFSLVYDHKFIKNNYFNYYRMNRDILFVCTMILKIFKNWQAVIVTGVILVNLSVLMAAQMCYKLTNKKGITLFVYILGIFLFDFSIRAFIPYTDNYGAFFLTAFLFVLINRRKNIKWMILGAVLLGMGCYIKFTVGILFIAGVIVICGLRIKEKKTFIKNMVVLLLVFACTFGGLTKIQNAYFKANGFVDNPEIERGFWHYFMMGQNDTYLGSYNQKDIRFTDSFANKKERDAGDRAEGIRRIKSRGINGNLFFYTYKNFQNYNDGCFAPVTGISKGEAKFEKSWVENLYLKGRESNRYYAMFQQIFWLTILGGILFAGLKVKSDNVLLLYLKVVILGVSAYALIFEGRAKYLFMFVPVYLVLAAVGLNELSSMKNQLKKIA